jgi:hypothetical protein
MPSLSDFDARTAETRAKLVAQQAASLQGLRPEVVAVRVLDRARVLEAVDKAAASTRAALASLPAAPPPAPARPAPPAPELPTVVQGRGNLAPPPRRNAPVALPARDPFGARARKAPRIVPSK